MMSLAAFALVILWPVSTGEKQAPQNCLLQTSQARGLVIQEDTPDTSPASVSQDSNDTEVKQEQDAAMQIEQVLKEMEAMSSSMLGDDTQVKVALQGTMKRMNTVVKDTFKKAFDQTQAKILSNVEAFEDANSKMRTAKVDADTANVDLDNCRQAEKESFESYEACVDESGWMNRTREEDCQAMEDAKFVEWNVDTSLTVEHTCDVSDPSCLKLEELQLQVDSLDNMTNARRDEYWEKHKQCKSSFKASLKQSNLCMEKQRTFLGVKAGCDSQDNDVRVAMCAFGHRLQEQCKQLDATNDFNKAVMKGTGTSYSETDRRDNWNRAQVLNCSLWSYTTGGRVNDIVENICETQVNYGRDVGVLQYYGERIMRSLHPSPPQFTCKESDIQFKGSIWEVGNTSAGYSHRALTSHAVTITPASAPPFDFCASNHSRARCRGFKCPAGWKAKASSLTSTCELRTCSKHECCTKGPGGNLPADSKMPPATGNAPSETQPSTPTAAQPPAATNAPAADQQTAPDLGAPTATNASAEEGA